jgi:hypothetical protein
MRGRSAGDEARSVRGICLVYNKAVMPSKAVPQRRAVLNFPPEILSASSFLH